MFFGSLKNWIKHLLKKYFYIIKVWDKFTPSVQIEQRRLFLYYQEMGKSNNVPAIKDTGYRVFSQHEEDGLLLFVFGIIGMHHKTFVEIGSNDGVNSNCANFAINFGWHGLFIDGDKLSIQRGKYFYNKYPDPWSYPPKFVCARITAENIDDVISKAGFSGNVDLLSIDIDGNDYWIWNAIKAIDPRVVIIETHVEFGYNNIVVPYDPHYFFPGKHRVYHGASPVAMNNLAKRKGYKLVGANNYGFNLIFVKNELGGVLLPEVTVESILQHPSAIESFKLYEDVKNWEYLPG